MEELLRSSLLTEDVMKILRTETEKAKPVAELLGQDAAKLYCARALIPAVLHRLEERQKVFQQKTMGTKQDGLQGFEAIFAKHFQEDTAPTGKLKALIERLQELVQTGECQCIVFVKEISATVPLATLLERHVKGGVGCVTGTSSMSDEVRQDRLGKFRERSLWCLVATDGFEEGVDIPACNVVVRFDVFHNVRSHVQGSGRCRGFGKGGLVIYFENDPMEYQEQALKVRAMAACSELVQTPPLSPEPMWEHPSTGAEINAGNCLDMLNKYVPRQVVGGILPKPRRSASA